MNTITIQRLLDILQRIEAQFGPAIAAAIARIVRARTTITYTPEQAEELLERELTAMEMRADDLARASRVAD